MGVLDLYRLDGRVGIVTGAGWGLGADFAVALAEAGADVVLAARRADRLATTVAAVEAAGRRALVVPADVADPDQCGVLAAVLGEVDEGFRYVQVRLGPARMAHVMRWLGAAVRAHETALDYVTSRSVFGRSLGDHGLAQHLIAENEIDLAATRALLDVARAALDGGSLAAQETSIARRSARRPSAGSWTGPCSCVAAWAFPQTCPSPASPGRSGPSGCTTGRPRCTASRSPIAR